MNIIEASLFILLLAALASPISERLHLPLEIFLLIGSCILSLIPGLPNYEIAPELAFSLFLPPILFHAAYLTSWRDFKRNRRPIAFLAIGLVIFTAAIVAAVVKFLLPHFSWPQCFLLGAIVSPPDASAATSIVKKLGAPRRLITVLEGESLVNDATALIVYRFALAAIFVNSFSFSHALFQFFYVTAGGLVIGWVIGKVFFSIIRKIHDSHAQTLLSIITAFACFFFAEHLGVSGVISAVTGGLYFGRRLPELTSSLTRIETISAWRNIIFIVNGAVFTLIGFQLPFIIKNLEDYSWTEILFDGLVVSITVIVVRLAWVFTATYVPWAFLPKAVRSLKRPHWQIALALGWIGMRGIVSLAAALAVPVMIAPGILFPDRGVILFITYCVILVSLIIPALTVPIILKVFNLKDSQEKEKSREEAYARIKSLEGIVNKIISWEENKKFPRTLTDEFKRQAFRKLRIVTSQASDPPFSQIDEDYFAVRYITKELIESERAILLHLRREGKIHDEVFHLLSEELDREDVRTKTLRI